MLAFNWQRFKAIFWKEIIQIKRDKASLGIALVMPLLMLFLFGYAVNTDVDHYSTVVWDQDQSRESRELLKTLHNSNYYDLNYIAQNYQEVFTEIDQGKAKVGIIIPSDFSKKINRQEQTAVQIFIDGTDPTVARNAVAISQMSVAAYEGQVNFKVIPMAIKKSAGINGETRVLYNPELKSLTFNIPGLIGLIMQNVTALLTAFAIVREKERGTMEQLIVTPVTSGELILGKLFPYIIIGVFSYFILIFTGVTWFNVPVKGSILLLTWLSLLFLITILAIGLLISTISKTQMQAMQLTFVLILPSVLLSGFIFPRESMPFLIKAIGSLFPLTYYLIILRGIFLKGISISYLWQETLILTGFAILLCLFTMFKFRKRLD